MPRELWAICEIAEELARQARSYRGAGLPARLLKSSRGKLAPTGGGAACEIAEELARQARSCRGRGAGQNSRVVDTLTCRASPMETNIRLAAEV